MIALTSIFISICRNCIGPGRQIVESEYSAAVRGRAQAHCGHSSLARLLRIDLVNIFYVHIGIFFQQLSINRSRIDTLNVKAEN